MYINEVYIYSTCIVNITYIYIESLVNKYISIYIKQYIYIVYK